MTRKATALLTLSLVLYFFANQTQVGWLYVMSALIMGLVLTARYFNRRMLDLITAERTFAPNAENLTEGDRVTLNLTLMSPRPSIQLRLTQINPLADPDSSEYHQKQFLTQLTSDPTTITTTFDVYRRGLHRFPPLMLATKAPFALFSRQRLLPNPETGVLVYPECRPLDTVSLFNQQPSVQLSRPRAGLGNEIMGVRPYRTGDSPRHIHWRSVARTGRLISKEFVDETQPGLAIALDQTCLTDPNLGGLYHASKHNPFETAVKIAASLGDYALRHGYPLHLVGEGMPYGPLTADILGQTLARLEPDAERPFRESLTRITQTFAAVILPYPREDVIPHLLSLAQRGHILRVYLFDPASYPHHPANTGLEAFRATLTAAQINTQLIHFNDDWTEDSPA